MMIRFPCFYNFKATLVLIYGSISEPGFKQSEGIIAVTANIKACMTFGAFFSHEKRQSFFLCYIQCVCISSKIPVE